MLYERWRQIALDHRKEIALHDLALGERWTFAELAVLAEEQPHAEAVVFPQGHDFIVSLLRAWRTGKAACPLEPGQAPPVIDEIPKGCAHLKLTSATTGAAR